MAIIFDPANKRVILDSASVTATELYSRSCDWLALSDNAKYGAVFRQVGSDDLGAGLSIPPYFFLQNTWRVRPMESNHSLTITGNLFVEGGGVPVVSTLGTYQVNVNYTVPVQAQGISTSVGGSGPTAESIAAAVVAALGGSGPVSSDAPTVVEITAGLLDALNATTIPVDMKKTNGITIIGTGSKLSPWRPA